MFVCSAVKLHLPTLRPVRAGTRCLLLLRLLLLLLLRLWHCGQAPFTLNSQLEVFGQRLPTAENLVGQNLSSELLQLDRTESRGPTSLLAHVGHASLGIHGHHGD